MLSFLASFVPFFLLAFFVFQQRRQLKELHNTVNGPLHREFTTLQQTVAHQALSIQRLVNRRTSPNDF